jgi:hypothetical protein
MLYTCCIATYSSESWWSSLQLSLFLPLDPKVTIIFYIEVFIHS